MEKGDSSAKKVEMPYALEILDNLKTKEATGLLSEMETRQKYANIVKDAFSTGSDTLLNIRPLDQLVHIDGFLTTVKESINGPVMEKVHQVRHQVPFTVLEKFPAIEYPDVGEYVRAHPVAFGFQVAGATVLTTSVLGLPILGALGFTSIGPAAGSAAAAWQSSLGFVQAGTFFAWCQSAAMGGAAVGTITGAGTAGAGVAGAAAVATVPGWKEKLAGAYKYASNAVRGTGASTPADSHEDDGVTKSKL